MAVNFPPNSPVTQQVIDIVNSTVVTAFPTYTGDQQTAYTDIVTALGTDPRAAYINLNIDLNTLYTNLKTMPAPSNLSQSSDWSSVQTQILSELSAASNVRQLFNNNYQCLNTLFIDKG